MSVTLTHAHGAEYEVRRLRWLRYLRPTGQKGRQGRRPGAGARGLRHGRDERDAHQPARRVAAQRPRCHRGADPQSTERPCTLSFAGAALRPRRRGPSARTGRVERSASGLDALADGVCEALGDQAAVPDVVRCTRCSRRPTATATRRSGPGRRVHDGAQQWPRKPRARPGVAEVDSARLGMSTATRAPTSSSTAPGAAAAGAGLRPGCAATLAGLPDATARPPRRVRGAHDPSVNACAPQGRRLYKGVQDARRRRPAPFRPPDPPAPPPTADRRGPPRRRTPSGRASTPSPRPRRRRETIAGVGRRGAGRRAFANAIVIEETQPEPRTRTTPARRTCR